MTSIAQTRSAGRLALWLAIAAVLVYGVVDAVRLFWVCDDAFISFRYAENLIAGKGLVFNAGEKVEGYTNFSWTMFVALGMRLGADPVVFANWLGLACYIATVALLLTATPRRDSPRLLLPIAALGISCHHHFKLFASCGLETPLFCFLVTALLVTTVRAVTPRGFLLVGCIGTFASMTRPDGLLLYGLAGLVAIGRGVSTRSVATIVAVALPSILVFLPYFIWKWTYYGYPFPNTFYAKSADKPYVSQGLLYTGVYFGCYWVLGVAFVGTAWLALRRGVLQRPAAMILMFVVPYLLFVVWVGGDFMFARFLLPVTPALYLGLEAIGLRLRGNRSVLLFTAGVAAASVLMIYPKEKLQTKPPPPWGFLEESFVYSPEYVAEKRAAGELLAELTRGIDVKIAFYGGQAMFAYYGKFAVAIEAMTGLTDERLAHQPIEKRGWIGHEKGASVGYLVERGVHFALVPMGPELGLVGPHDHLRRLRIRGLELTIVTWSREVMDRLSTQEGVVFTNVEEYLEDYLQTIEALAKPRLLADLAWFKSFYFDHNDDPERLARLERAVRR